MTDSPPMTMFVPDFPFAYDDWLRHPGGLGALPEGRLGTEVAVIGGGVSGMTVAYELLKLGLRPVLYEGDQIGGRMRSIPFAADPGYVAEMGAMRFPAAASTLFHYIDALGLATKPFPNPLTPASSSTVVNFEGATHWATTDNDLPEEYQHVAEAWMKALNERAELQAIQAAIRARDVPVLRAVWSKIVKDFDDESLYGFLAGTAGFNSFRLREIFGQVGFGVGSWDTDFPSSALETLRIVCVAAGENQFSVVGGAQQIPRGLWNRVPARMAHWPSGTSVASLHEGTPLSTVASIARAGELFDITDVTGETRTYPAVVFTPHLPTLLTTIDSDRALLSPAHWAAVERAHYLGASKLFVLTDRPFWLDVDTETGHETMGMTITDQLPRSVYLFDDGMHKPGVVCLSYTLNNDSRRLSTLTPDERVDTVLEKLRSIYPGVDIRSHLVGPPVAISWENEPHFGGAFRTSLPGHYRYQRRLFTHFRQDDFAPERRGFFLSGDDISWTPGFAEGAVMTGLNAVWGVLNHLGGRTHPGNPGPGDVFSSIAPVELPE
jgi:monoamine oxidase